MGIVLVYDITERDSFDSINYWIQNINQHTEGLNLSKILVGNKLDLENSSECISEIEGQQLAKK